MEPTEEARKLISEAQNIYIIPSKNNESESISSALALFYTLKELNKNVNVIINDFPEKLFFLIPSLDFISSPKNFVISIPKSLADVSQIYYEKNEEDLKIHLTINKGEIKKDYVSFYLSDVKPDLIITLGIKDFQNQLLNTLDSFGFILDSPILNIDSQSLDLVQNEQENNKKFGSVNLIENKSLSEIILALVKSVDGNMPSKNTANCLLTGLMIHYDNFKNREASYEIFETAAELIKKGAMRSHIIDNLYKKATEEQIKFLSEIFKNLKTDEKGGIFFALLNSNDFQDFTESQINSSIEKINMIEIQSKL